MARPCGSRSQEDVAAPAEVAGLIGLGGRVCLRHLLVGSAVYQTASPVTGGRRIGSWPRQPIRTPIPIARRGIAPTRHRGLTRRWPTRWSAGPTGRESGEARPRRSCSWNERRADARPARRSMRAIAAAEVKLDACAPDTACKLLATAEMGQLDDL